MRLFRFLVSFGMLFGHRRVFGLSAEAAFWATFTLPWLVLGLVSATAGVANLLGEDKTSDVEDAILRAASRVLTQESIDQFLRPLINSVLQGSTGLTILGLVAALWSGSRVFATFVEGSLIINGMPPRGYVKTRGLALAIYVLGLASIGAVAFTVFTWPEAWSSVVGIAPGPNVVYWVVLALVIQTMVLTTILFLADPDRNRWRTEIPGGLLALGVWLLGSYGLSIYLQWLLGAGSIYGAIAAPIAIMLWMFVSVLSIFVGLTLNATLRMSRRGRYLTLEDPPTAVFAPVRQEVPPREDG